MARVLQNNSSGTITSLPNSSTRMLKTSWNNLDGTSNQRMNLSFNYLVVKLAMLLFPVRCWRNLRFKRSSSMASVSRLCWENLLKRSSTWINGDIHCIVASGLMDYEKGMKFLLRLFSKLFHWESVDRLCGNIAEAVTRYYMRIIFVRWSTRC
jgi:hypothetical protein